MFQPTRRTTTDWHYRAAIDLMLMLLGLLEDLTAREVRILWECAAMDRAMQKLLPMCEYGFERRKDGIVAQTQAGV